MSVREYPKFKFMPEWRNYAVKKCDWRRRIALYDAISLYGCFAVEEELQNAEDQAYFETKVIPELDRQHKLLEDGKEI